MGTSGIIAQAPFIPVAGALMPMLAPIVAFHAISTIMVMNQFKGIHEKLDHIEKSISRLIKRSEAIFVGEILSASNRIEEIEAKFRVCNHFTSEMIIRLALIEDKVNPIFERYKFLYQTQEVDKQATIEDLKFKQNDAYFAIILSILDLRIDLLRLKLDIQENPGYIKHSIERLIEKSSYYNELWTKIGDDPKLVEGVAENLRIAVEEMNWWHKSVPAWLGGKKEEQTQKISSLEKHADVLKREFHENLDEAYKSSENLRKSLVILKPMNLVYWRDEFGEHSYYTDDIELLPV
jgi:uncharacterized protein Yka (UPF0111/DUF47 family)